MTQALEDGVLWVGEGFYLRTLLPSDAAALHAIAADPEVMRYVGDGTPLTAELAALWIERTRANYATVGYGTFGVVETATESLIGWAGFIPPGREPMAEIIYGLARHAWGKGLGRRLATALTRLGQEKLGIEPILATIDEANAPSRRIVEGLGYRLEAIVAEGEVMVCRYILDQRIASGDQP